MSIKFWPSFSDRSKDVGQGQSSDQAVVRHLREREKVGRTLGLQRSNGLGFRGSENTPSRRERSATQCGEQERHLYAGLTL